MQPRSNGMPPLSFRSTIGPTGLPRLVIRMTFSRSPRVTGPTIAAGAVWVSQTRLIDNVRRLRGNSDEARTCWTSAGTSWCTTIAGSIVSRAQRGPAVSNMKNKGLTAVEGLKVGQHTLSERPTGCTVVIVDGEGAIGGYTQRGGAPGTRDSDLLNPLNAVEQVNAIFSPAVAPTASASEKACRATWKRRRWATRSPGRSFRSCQERS
jgi:hypothetical protein